MDFTLPTSKAEMYETLKDIYRYYRINKEGYTPTTVPAFTLSKITFTPLTDLEIEAKAETLVSAEQEKVIAERTLALTREQYAYNCKTTKLYTELSELETKINAEYDATEQKVTADAEKRGLADSTILTSKLADLEVKRNLALTDAQTKFYDKINEADSQLQSLTYEIQNISTFFADRFLAEKNKKIAELKEEQDKTVLEIKKYNDAQDEKMLRQSISTVFSNANLQLKYMSLNANSFTKEQLVYMGYYTDVAKCVGAVYDSMTPMSAFQDFSNETDLIFYLDDYYQDMLYMYRTLAGL